jgi:hypothetical protein
MSSDSPASATDIGRAGPEQVSKNLSTSPRWMSFNSSNAARGKITGCRVRRQIPAGRWRPDVARMKFQQLPQRFGFKCGWSPSTMAQLAISGFQPFQFAAQTMELNMPRSGCGFSMRSDLGKSSGPIRRQARVVRPVDDGDLRRAEFLPLPEVADDGGIAPRQQQFWPAHAR